MLLMKCETVFSSALLLFANDWASCLDSKIYVSCEGQVLNFCRNRTRLRHNLVYCKLRYSTWWYALLVCFSAVLPEEASRKFACYKQVFISFYLWCLSVRCFFLWKAYKISFAVKLELKKTFGAIIWCVTSNIKESVAIFYFILNQQGWKVVSISLLQMVFGN